MSEKPTPAQERLVEAASHPEGTTAVLAQDLVDILHPSTDESTESIVDQARKAARRSPDREVGVDVEQLRLSLLTVDIAVEIAEPDDEPEDDAHRKELNARDAANAALRAQNEELQRKLKAAKASRARRRRTNQSKPDGDNKD